MFFQGNLYICNFSLLEQKQRAGYLFNPNYKADSERHLTNTSAPQPHDVMGLSLFGGRSRGMRHSLAVGEETSTKTLASRVLYDTRVKIPERGGGELIQ